jgi:general stress protein 26
MRPDDPAVRKILRRSMVARLATVSRNGRPNLNPLYFVLREGCIWLGTVDASLAARNVKANPRVAVLFTPEHDGPSAPLVRITGTATVRMDQAVTRAYVRADAPKYVLTPGGLANFFSHPRQARHMPAYLGSDDKGHSCVIEVLPAHAEFVAQPRQPARE